MKIVETRDNHASSKTRGKIERRRQRFCMCCYIMMITRTKKPYENVAYIPGEAFFHSFYDLGQRIFSQFTFKFWILRNPKNKGKGRIEEINTRLPAYGIQKFPVFVVRLPSPKRVGSSPRVFQDVPQLMPRVSEYSLDRSLFPFYFERETSGSSIYIYKYISRLPRA